MSENASEDDQVTYEPLTTEDLEIALAPYNESPGAALSLGINLMVLKNFLAVDPPKIQKAIEGIDCALEVLFPHTEFHVVSFDYFLKFVEGKLTREEEKMLKALGVNF